MTEPLMTSITEATTEHSADIPENDHLWRSMTSAHRDIKEIDFDRQRENAIWVSKVSGIAKRFVEIMVDFTAGEEPHPQAEDKELQEVLTAYWDDPVNCLRKFSRELAGQLRLIGEQIVTVHIQETTGRLRLGYLDPAFVQAIVPMPGNPRDLVEVQLLTATGDPTRVFRIIRPGEKLHEIYEGVTEDGKRAPGKFQLKPRDRELKRLRDPRGRLAPNGYDGACFLFSVNKLSNATRGLSDLFAEIDFLERLDDVVFDTAERASLLKALALDVEVTGCSDEKVLKKMERTVRTAFSKKLGSFSHNETVQVTAHVPDLKSADMRELVKIIMLHLLGSWGFPLHWFADGGEANLATAGEMGGPTIRKLQSAQTTVRQMLRTMADFQIALKVALAPEELSGVEDLTAWKLILPEIVGKDTAREAQSLSMVTAALTQATVEGWLTDKTAALWWQEKAQQILSAEIRDEDRELLDKLDEDQKAEMEGDGEEGFEPPSQGEGEIEVGDEEASAQFNELTLAIQRLATIGDAALIDALRNELFARLGMEKPDTLEPETIVDPAKALAADEEPTTPDAGSPFEKNAKAPLPDELKPGADEEEEEAA